MEGLIILIRCELFQFGNTFSAKRSQLLCFCSIPPSDQFVVSIGSIMAYICKVFCFCCDWWLSFFFLCSATPLYPHRVFFFPNHTCCYWKLKPISFCVQSICFLWLMWQSTNSDKYTEYNPEEDFYFHFADFRGFQNLLSSYPANFVILLCNTDPLGRIFLTAPVSK